MCQPICTNYSACNDILLSNTPETSFSFTVFSTPSEIVDPTPCQSIRIRKATQLPNFAYPCYSLFFFLAFIQYLTEFSFYKETILDFL